MREVGAALAPCLGGAQKRPESGREVRPQRRRSCPLCRGAELRTRLPALSVDAVVVVVVPLPLHAGGIPGKDGLPSSLLAV